MSVRDYDVDLTVTAARQSVPIQPNIKNVMVIWLNGYNIRGVDVQGNGIPTSHDYYLRLGPLSMIDRVTTVNCPTANAVPLQLFGEVSQRWYDTPIQLTSSDPKNISQFDFELTRPDGSAAVFESATVYLTVVTYNDQKSLAEAISLRPGINQDLNARARPWIR